jgi:hypothetical protein
MPCDMPPSGAADQPGGRGAVKPIDEFIRQQEPGPLGPVRRAAPRDLDDGDGFVGCIVNDSPPFAPDSNEVAMVQLRRMRGGHGPRGCTTHSVAGGAVLERLSGRYTETSHRVTEAQSCKENPRKPFSCVSVSLWPAMVIRPDRSLSPGGESVRNLPASAEARASICA